MMLNEEHAHAIASAVSDYISAQYVRCADRPRALDTAYKALVARITDALNSIEGKVESVRFEARGMPLG